MANLSGFDLNLLRVLDALLREHSTTRAADRLGLSQPAVSAALRRLRLSLGDELFFRRGQRLEATQFARDLELPLRDLLDRAEAFLAGPGRFDPAHSEARLRVSGSDFFAELLMPQLAERLRVLAPGMKVHLVDLVPDNNIETLERYEVDIALLPALPLPEWIDSLSVFRSPYLVIARQGNPRLARAGVQAGQVLPLDLYCDLSHVLFSPEGRPDAMGDAALARVGRSRRVVMTLPYFSGVYRAVAGSDLIALLPEPLARHVADDVGLSLYQPPMAVAPSEIVMIWHRRYTSSLPHRWLRGQIGEILTPLGQAPALAASPS